MLCDQINAKDGGRKPGLSAQEGICLILIYLRQKPIFEILGLLLDISKTKANDAFHYWVNMRERFCQLLIPI